MLSFIPLEDSVPVSPQSLYDHATQLFLHGYLDTTQQEAEQGYRRFRISDPDWARKFRLLQTRAMVWRGAYEPALRILHEEIRAPAGVEQKIEERTLQAVALTHLQQLSAADEELTQAENQCAGTRYAVCGGVLRARGILAMERAQFPEARKSFLASLAFARAYQDKPLETTALVNLGYVSLEDEHYDEALEWSTSAYQAGLQSGDENRAQGALGNMGWAYVRLGDAEKGLDLFLEAEQRAAKLGNLRQQLEWLTTAGYVYESSGDFSRAAGADHRALTLAQQIDSKEDIVNSLESLAHLAIDSGHPDEAARYLQQLDPLIRANGNHLDALDVTLAHARIAAARHQDQQAESLFRTVDTDPASQITMRLAAEHFLADLYEQQGRVDAAKAEYTTALATFESERNQLRNENSRLPFFANATPIYDDYIHLLIQQGQVNQALAAADQSRARTLAQGLGLAQTADPVALHPTAIARSADATLLFYWLGEKQSYLWAVTPQKTAVFTLPAERTLAPYLDRYRQTLLGPDDPSRDPDGQALYRILVAPAARLLRLNARIVILSDGILSQLNFETLIVPGPTPHYFIEDADILSAPSLHMLAAAHTASSPVARRLLLLGNAVSPNPDYPQLPNAAVEMQEIRRHFAPHDQTVFAGPRATPAAYLASAPRQFSDIDFVAHGVASQTDPLDSAIILSRPGPSPHASGSSDARPNEAEAAFKLYARDIIQHPIDARLVTISTCSGSGSRSYAGEGLVGLSWAFLRAGAHNVIAALWEASDASTPRLMNTLYDGLEQGLSPSAALRQAKLALLHSNSAFRRPFYWAPFQLYTGL